jgi:hypothetical protein
MGQAKNRGTLEERTAKAIEKLKLEEEEKGKATALLGGKAIPIAEVAAKVLEAQEEVSEEDRKLRELEAELNAEIENYEYIPATGVFGGGRPRTRKLTKRGKNASEKKYSETIPMEIILMNKTPKHPNFHRIEDWKKMCKNHRKIRKLIA